MMEKSLQKEQNITYIRSLSKSLSFFTHLLPKFEMSKKQNITKYANIDS